MILESPSRFKPEVHLPGAEPVMEKDEEYPIPKDPVNRDLPDVESSNAGKDDHPTIGQPVEGSLSGQPEAEVLDESSVVESGREMAQITDQEQPDADSESSENSNREYEGSDFPNRRERDTLKASKKNQSKVTETEGLVPCGNHLNSSMQRDLHTFRRGECNPGH